jgi:D-xylose transport system permease protein
VAGGGFTVFQLANGFSRRRNGLKAMSAYQVLAVGLVLTIGMLVVVEVLDRYFGLPLPVFIMLVLLVVFSYVTKRTRFGRHIFATGGNAEAARRAGISITRVRWSVFVISGFMAGVGSIIFMARIAGGSAGAVAPDYLLLVIASAVIGGTSLFGGRGSVWSALTGALMLASVQAGMGLTLASSTNSEYYEFIVEGAILLGAVWLDTFVRSRSTVDRRT